ncbi:MAG: hypothetical protein E7317_07365 [Clostridiales bacterium]|nr:hypothetical protein [Clostridiales bacterium]
MYRRRRRVTGRFFIILAVLIAIVIVIVRPHIHFGSRQDTIFTSTTAYQEVMDAVIIRDEAVTESSSTVRVEYMAKEVSAVKQGDTIANLYTTGYTENLLTRLETTRQNIQSYHKTLLGTIVDTNLDRLDAVIDMISTDFKNLANRDTRGNLQSVVEQLQTAMVNRQEYLRQNKRDDTKLTKLYEEENTRLNSIQSWRQVSTAPRDGVVSFYLDGYETNLTADGLEDLKPQDLRAVLNGEPLSRTADVLRDGIYRIVDQEKWYVAVMASSSSWNPAIGENYYLQFYGFEDLNFVAQTTSVLNAEGMVVAVFQIDEPIGPMIYQRTGKVTLSRSLMSLAVNVKALYNLEGQLGVWLNDIPGGTFVPVNVLYRDNGVAYIEPLVDGALSSGQTILIK